MLARRYGKPGARLLEIGSGMGHLVGQLEDKFETYGIDPKSLGGEPVQRSCTKEPTANRSRQELPFTNNSFNVVIIKHIVEHLPDPQRAIQEIGRVTERGGSPNSCNPKMFDSLLKPWKGDSWIGYQDPTHISLKRPTEWLSLINDAGFSLIKVFSDGFWDVPYMGWDPKADSETIFWIAWRLSGHYRLCLSSCALGGKHHRHCEKDVRRIVTTTFTSGVK